MAKVHLSFRRQIGQRSFNYNSTTLKNGRSSILLMGNAAQICLFAFRLMQRRHLTILQMPWALRQ
ncbi:hypothetical protein CVU37_11270 [candidate division BRC1 bacterium HGW-BRC1-1]|nr:MAG: hypothetical protein CVU37_11270 [candidate division BRC1 bacterium HGW-BRC1-1]